MAILKFLIQTFYDIASDQSLNYNELEKHLKIYPYKGIKISDFDELPKQGKFDIILTLFIEALKRINGPSPSIIYKICDELSPIDSVLDNTGMGKLFDHFTQNDPPIKDQINQIIRAHSLTIVNEKLNFKIINAGNMYQSNTSRIDFCFQLPRNEKILFDKNFRPREMKNIFSQVDSCLAVTIDGNEVLFEQILSHRVPNNSMNELFLYEIVTWEVSAGDFFIITNGLSLHILEANEHVLRFKVSGSDYNYGNERLLEENEDFSIGSHGNNKIFIRNLEENRIDFWKSDRKWLMKNNHANKPIYIGMLSFDKCKQHKFKLISKNICHIMIRDSLIQFEIR